MLGCFMSSPPFKNGYTVLDYYGTTIPEEFNCHNYVQTWKEYIVPDEIRVDQNTKQLVQKFPSLLSSEY